MSRKKILTNSMWGNLNIFLRYGASFIATAIIARKFGPEDFGLYQLALTFAVLFDFFAILNPTHLRNHLVANPEDTKLVVGSWKVVNLTTTFFLFTSLIILYFFSPEEKVFFLLLSLASLHLLFKVFEFPQILLDAHLRSDLVQKAQMVSHGSFNILRSGFAFFGGGLNQVASASFFQGLIYSFYQINLMKKLSLPTKGIFNKAFTIKLIKESFPIMVMMLLSVLQARIFSLILPARMDMHDYGNLQLILKIFEPITSLGAVIISANYIILAKTYENNKKHFLLRFFKVALLTLSISIISSVILYFIPVDYFIQIFGESYTKGFENIWAGLFIAFVSVLFSLLIQFDLLTKRYLLSIYKYLFLIAGHTSILFFDDISIRNALLINIFITSITILVFIPWKRIISFWKLSN